MLVGRDGDRGGSVSGGSRVLMLVLGGGFGVFVDFGFKDQRGDFPLLETRHDKACCEPGKDRSEKDSLEQFHFLSLKPPGGEGLVAGEAHGMAGIVRAIVQPHVIGETDAEQQRHTNEKGQAPGDQPLRDGKTGNAGSLGNGIHRQHPPCAR
jgi:hypothetical protein